MMSATSQAVFGKLVIKVSFFNYSLTCENNYDLYSKIASNIICGNFNYLLCKKVSSF